MKIPDWLPESQHPTGPNRQPRRPLIAPLLGPVVRFLHIEAASGFVLLACTAVA